MIASAARARSMYVLHDNLQDESQNEELQIMTDSESVLQRYRRDIENDPHENDVQTKYISMKFMLFP